MNKAAASTPVTPQVILLHGAGLGSWIWDAVTPNLSLPCKALNLPGRSGAANLSRIGLQSAIDAVASQSTAHTVIVGHSFSAAVALGVASQYPGSVAGIVLVGGVVSESGKSFLSNLPLPMRAFLGTYIRLSRKGVKLPASLIEAEYCNDLPATTRDNVLSNITPEVPRYYLDKLDWHLPSDIPCHYVKLLQDTSLSLPQQDQFGSRLPGASVETLPTGHLPMLAKPEQTALLLNRLCNQMLDVTQSPAMAI
ncbi:MAG: alpha/beta hydrolase [Bacteroidota bacterium]